MAPSADIDEGYFFDPSHSQHTPRVTTKEIERALLEAAHKQNEAALEYYHALEEGMDDDEEGIDFNRENHPECKPDELFLVNYQGDIHELRYDHFHGHVHIPNGVEFDISTLRQGKTSYDTRGNPYKTSSVYPYFVKNIEKNKDVEVIEDQEISILAMKKPEDDPGFNIVTDRTKIYFPKSMGGSIKYKDLKDVIESPQTFKLNFQFKDGSERKIQFKEESYQKFEHIIERKKYYFKEKNS